MSFGITFDYRCPFACNVHDHIVEALLSGAPWDVRFMPFSLGQAHVEPGEPDVWDHPESDTGLLALQAGVAVRDHQPERFLEVHRALFRARHIEGRKLQDPLVLYETISAAGADAEQVFTDIDSGEPLEVIRGEHEHAVDELSVWGVPTFVVDGKAAFVRLMAGAGGDASAATATVERIVSMMTDWPELNEFKYTTLAS